MNENLHSICDQALIHLTESVIIHRASVPITALASSHAATPLSFYRAALVLLAAVLQRSLLPPVADAVLREPREVHL